MNPHDDKRLQEISARLDRLRRVPTDILGDIVSQYGLCLWADLGCEPPELAGGEQPDRELAAQYCAGCPVQDECLEWELRLHGSDTVGIWGGLSEDDRRALYPLWRARGDRPGERVDGGEPR